MIPGQNEFSDMARHDGGAISLPGRAGDLARAMQPLWDVTPVMQSRHLVKGWLDRGAFSVIYGDSNVGKTFLALDMAIHVAAGADWRGHRVPGGDRWAGHVLYIACEGGNGISNRLEAIRRANPDLVRAEDDSFRLMKSGLDLCTSEDAHHLAAAICETLNAMPSLITVDTLARTMGGGDENAAKDMAQFIRSVDLLREAAGAHVMVVHHSGKDASKGARGSGSLRAAVDTEIELTRNETGVVTAEAKKQRDMACGGAFAYTIKGVLLGHDEDGEPVTSGILEPCEVPEAAPKAPRLTGADQVALEALSDALAHHGKAMAGDMFPAGRLCVSLEIWREMCDRHSLTAGDSPTSKRTAFHKVKTRLQEKHMVRIVDGFVWRVADNDDRSQRSQAVPGTLGTGGVPAFPPSKEGGNAGTLGPPCTPARHNPSRTPPVTLMDGQPQPTPRPRPDWCPEMPRPFPSTSLFLASTLPSAGCLTAAAGGCGGAVVLADLIGSRAARLRQPGKNPRFFCGGKPCGGPFPAFICMCVAFQTALYLYFRGRVKLRFPQQMPGGRVLRNLKWHKIARPPRRMKYRQRNARRMPATYEETQPRKVPPCKAPQS